MMKETHSILYSLRNREISNQQSLKIGAAIAGLIKALCQHLKTHFYTKSSRLDKGENKGSQKYRKHFNPQTNTNIFVWNNH